MRRRFISFKTTIVLTGLVLGVLDCSRAPERELASWPLDDMGGVISKQGVKIDRDISSDKGGSLRISADEPMVVRLFETGDLGVEDARLNYRAQVRTESVTGKVYLEMWCLFPEKGQFFSRGLNNTLSGTSQWKTLHMPFFLRKGENPDNVFLNIVIDGKGTVWIDDIRLTAGPL